MATPVSGPRATPGATYCLNEEVTRSHRVRSGPSSAYDQLTLLKPRDVLRAMGFITADDGSVWMCTRLNDDVTTSTEAWTLFMVPSGLIFFKGTTKTITQGAGEPDLLCINPALTTWHSVRDKASARGARVGMVGPSLRARSPFAGHVVTVAARHGRSTIRSGSQRWVQLRWERGRKAYALHRSSPEQDPFLLTTPIVAVEAEYSVVCGSPFLPVLAWPDLQATRVGRLPVGSLVRVTGVIGHWLRIKLPTFTAAWALASESGSPGLVPHSAEPPRAPPAPAYPTAPPAAAAGSGAGSGAGAGGGRGPPGASAPSAPPAALLYPTPAPMGRGTDVYPDSREPPLPPPTAPSTGHDTANDAAAATATPPPAAVPTLSAAAVAAEVARLGRAEIAMAAAETPELVRVCIDSAAYALLRLRMGSGQGGPGAAASAVALPEWAVEELSEVRQRFLATCMSKHKAEGGRLWSAEVAPEFKDVLLQFSQLCPPSHGAPGSAAAAGQPLPSATPP